MDLENDLNDDIDGSNDNHDGTMDSIFYWYIPVIMGSLNLLMKYMEMQV